VGGFTSLGHQEKTALLKTIGVGRFEDLLKGIPESVRLKSGYNLPEGVSEIEALRHLGHLASNNCPGSSWNTFLGGGIYDHYIPSATQSLLQRSEFITAYTPYQAEVSQGTLQGIYEYQSMVGELTGMAVANASMYDGATALAEAMIMSRSIRRKGGSFIIPQSLNPHYREVLETYQQAMDISLVSVNTASDGTVDLAHLKSLLGPDVFGVVLMSPNFFGVVESVSSVAALKANHPFLLTVIPNLLGLSLFEAPGKIGADICVGEAHYFASGPGFGGPLLGFMATHKKHLLMLISFVLSNGPMTASIPRSQSKCPPAGDCHR